MPRKKYPPPPSVGPCAVCEAGSPCYGWRANAHQRGDPLPAHRLGDKRIHHYLCDIHKCAHREGGKTCSDVKADGGTLCHYHVQRTVDSAEASRSKRQPLPPNPTRLPSSAPSYIVDHLGVGAVSPQNSVLQHSVLVLPDNYLVFVPGPGDNIVKLRNDVIASWNGQPTPRPSTGDWVTKDTPAVIERSTVSPPTSTFEDCVSEYLHGSLVAVASTVMQCLLPPSSISTPPNGVRVAATIEQLAGDQRAARVAVTTSLIQSGGSLESIQLDGTDFEGFRIVATPGWSSHISSTAWEGTARD